MSKKLTSIIILVLFFISSCFPIPWVQAQTAYIPDPAIGNVLNLPAVGSMVPLSENFNPALLKGLRLDKENPLKFDFILDVGKQKLSPEDLEVESSKLIKYFLASLTIPEEDLWVNLSPYERDRIVPKAFGITEMGRDLLAQDYLLKQVTASLMYPEKDLGREFWDRIYEKAYERFGTTDVLVNTFNKIWIIPDYAEVYMEGETALIVDCHLKVMTEQDYVAKAAAENKSLDRLGLQSQKLTELGKANMSLASEVIRELLIPEIEKEINTGKNFIQLRQIYHSLILATWFKNNLKESIVSKVYVGRNKVEGVDVEDKEIKDKIFQQYIEAFKEGVYNYVREDYDPMTQRIMPRKYFSGGAGFENVAQVTTLTTDKSRKAVAMQKIDSAMLVKTNLTKPSIVKAMVNRRQFLKWAAISGLTLASNMAKPAILEAFTPEFLEQEEFDKEIEMTQAGINFAFDHYKTLSEQMGVNYFKQISAALVQKTVPRLRTGRFLWQLFVSSPVMWIRAEAVAVMVKHNYLNRKEINQLFESIFDDEVLSALALALSENPTPANMNLLAERVAKEHKPKWIMEAFYKALEKAPMEILKPQLLALVAEDDIRALAILAPKHPPSNRKLVNMSLESREYFDALGKAATPEAVNRLFRSIVKQGVLHLDRTDAIVALGETKTARAEQLLLEWSRRPGISPRERSTLAQALLAIGSETSLQRGKKLVDSLTKKEDMTRVMRFLTEYAPENEPVTKMILDFARANTRDSKVRRFLAQSLSQIGTPEAINILIEWVDEEVRTMDPKGLLDFEQQEVFLALARTESSLAEQKLLSLADAKKMEYKRHIITTAFTIMHSPGSFNWLRERYDATDDTFDRSVYIEALMNHTSIEAFLWLNELIISGELERIDDAEEFDDYYVSNVMYQVMDLAGYYAFENYINMLLSGPDQLKPKVRSMMASGVRTFVDTKLYRVNNDRNLTYAQKEDVYRVIAKRLRKNPIVLYLTLGLAQEIDSHSFPVFFNAFNEYLSDFNRYGAPDFFRFAEERLNNEFLADYFLTLIIFNKFDQALSRLRTIYPYKKIVGKIFNGVSLEGMLDKPVLVSKLIEATLNYMKREDTAETNRIIADIIPKDTKFLYLIKLMIEMGTIKDLDPIILDAVKDVTLPDLAPVWQGPQKEWVNKDGEIEASMFWATTTEEELSLFNQFPKVILLTVNL